MASYGSHEYQVHHHVSELMKLLGLSKDSGAGAQEYLLTLMKSITPYISTQVSTHNAKRKIAENSPTPKEFLQKYEELKGKNVRDLDALVFLLSKVTDDEQTKDYLAVNAERRASQAMAAAETSSVRMAQTLPLPSSQSPAHKMTGDELDKLRAQLNKVTMEPNVVPSVSIRKVLREQHLARNIDFPEVAEWAYNRTFLTMDFVPDMIPSSQDALPLQSLPVKAQELLIVEDLLGCLEGTDGKYIVSQPLSGQHSSREFIIEGSLDPSIRELTKRILPLSSNYSLVTRFIEEKSMFEFGSVNQALAAAMRTLLKDYLVLVAQLEEQFRQGNLLLQKLWYSLQPTMHSMTTMAAIASAINRSEMTGGGVLSILHEKTLALTGDSKAQELVLFLTQSACVPYFEILEKWIYRGLIVDPYAEFLVEENKAFEREKLVEDYNDAYWELHCVIIPSKVPCFLEKSAEKILNTGKYLNVVRQCGRDITCPREELLYGMREQKLLEPIDAAYRYASKLLLDLLMEEKDLMQRFRSVKHYFLLDQGDFIVQFLDMAEEEMRQHSDQIVTGRLESLLELALRCSTTDSDPYKDDLRVELLPFDLTTQLFKVMSIETQHEKDYNRIDPTDIDLTGLEAFSFDYVVKWPLSLVLNRKVLTRYQMLFRQLFYCKHVERQLCNVWLTNKSSKRMMHKASPWHATGFALRQRMLNFVQGLQYFMMFEVIEPQWHKFVDLLNKAENIDQVLSCQTDFLDSCLKDCMLTNQELLKILQKIMVVCVTFSNFVQRVSQSSNVEFEVSRLASSTLQAAPTTKQRREEPQQKEAMQKVVTEHVDQLTSSKDFERTIARFNKNFTDHLVSLLKEIQHLSTAAAEHNLIHVVYRLDFNGFYSAATSGR